MGPVYPGGWEHFERKILWEGESSHCYWASSKEVEGKVKLVVSGKRYIIRVEEEESFRKVVSNKSFIDLDSEAKEEDDDMAQNNNDLEDGFDGMEATNDIVEASKAKNNTEKEFEPDPPNQFFVECQLEEHGESKRRVEDDQ